MAVDHLYAVEAVVVDAERAVHTIVATRDANDPHRELWWAHTGGGGGNFGVVTRYWFRSSDAVGNDPRTILPRPPEEVLCSSISLPWTQMTKPKFTALLRNFGAFYEEHKDPASPCLAVTGGLQLTHRSNGQIVMNTQVDNGLPNADRLLANYHAEILRDVEPDTEPQPLRMPWLQSVRLFGGSIGKVRRAVGKSAFMRANFPDNQIEALYRYLNDTGIYNPWISVSISGFGGRINALSYDETAFVHRDCSLSLLWSAVWANPADDAKYIGWVQDFYGAVYADTGGVPVPNAVTDGCYVNDADTDVADPRFNKSAIPWYGLYYKENYSRLRQVKAKWDPLNFFRHGLSIQLPEGN
jgi:hypothetical protein